MSAEGTVYTVGYSGFALPDFLAELRNRGTAALKRADEPYNGKYFKFAAKIFPIQEDGGGGQR